jgi:hypothetical protein
MGRKIINGIEVNTNLKRRRVEIKQGCQSTIIESSPLHYWQFESISTDIESVTSSKLLSSTVNEYGASISGVDNTLGIVGYPLGQPSEFVPETIELKYDTSGNTGVDFEDISPVCPIPDATINNDLGQPLHFYEAFGNFVTYSTDADLERSLEPYNSGFNSPVSPGEV